MQFVTFVNALHAARMVKFGLVIGAVGATAALSSLALATAQTAPAKPAAKPAAAAPKEAQAAPKDTTIALVDAQPVVHAKGAQVSTCLTAVSELSRMSLDAPYAALSTWNKTAANDHVFASIVGLKYDNQVAPRAVSVLSASPTANKGCDGESVQVQPSNLSCDAIQKNLASASMKVQDLNGVTLVAGEGPIRYALLPTAGNGCAVVGIGTYFAK